jgi:outer membrane protein assembly factor BamA
MGKRGLIACIVGTSLTSALHGRAQSTASAPRVEAAGPVDVTPPPALPAFLSGKRKISDYDLAQKQEGAYLTGLPLVDSDPDTGFGFGARVYRYWDGEHTDPLFEYTPYRHRVFGQVFATTNGYQDHTIDYDAPYLGGSAFRLRASVYYERNKAANYFGRGASTLGGLSFAGRTFATFDDYTSASRQLTPGPNGAVAYTLYDKYDLEDPGIAATVERDFFGGVVRVQAGLAASYVRVRDYTGAPIKADDAATGRTNVDATMGTTHLRDDCDAARIVGCAGGRHDTLKLGVAFDTRDFEPDPNAGFFFDLTAELSSRYIGSEYDYARVTFSPRAFVSPLPKLADVVLAGRAVYSVQTDGTPFFAMNNLAFTDGDRQGLGGLRSLRGYKQDRFVGPVAAMANVEVRWTFVDFTVASQSFALSVAPFLDIGRVFDKVGDFTFSNWKRGQGAGLRVAWNKATVIVFDYGISSEDSGLYMDFGHQF